MSEYEESVNLTPGVVWTESQLAVIRHLVARLHRCRAVMDRCNEARAQARDRGHTLEAMSYDDVGEWLRRALDGEP